MKHKHNDLLTSFIAGKKFEFFFDVNKMSMCVFLDVYCEI